MRKVHFNKRKKILPLVLSLGFLLTGCGGTAASTGQGAEGEPTSFSANVVNLAEGVEQKKQQEAIVPEDHSRAMSSGAVRILSKTMELGEKNENCLVSPFSLQMAFGMLTTGSTEGSTTEKELMEFLMPGVTATPKDLNAELATMAKSMRSGDSGDWNVVNSIWVKKDGNVKLRDSYISDVVNGYQAELYSAPFDSSTVKEINAWVKKNTRERIPEILKELDPETALILINALAFTGEWDTPVEDGMVKKDADFTNADGTVSKVNMLQSEERGYVQLAGGDGFLKHYKGGKYCFLGLLPPEGVTAEDYLKNILSEKNTLYDAIRNADYDPNLQVEFPEFKTEYGTEMTEMLQALGVQKVFTPEAELGKMITEDSEKASVSQVVQKTMIEVDRKGTKAAAATEIAVTEAGIIGPDGNKEIRLNRPFVYGIIDMDTCVPVFLGVQNTMAK